MEQNNKNQNTALLVMDVQSATVKMLKDDMYFINSITKVIQTARKNKMPVIYVVVGFRKGYPEVIPNNKFFSVLKNRTIHFDTEEAAKVYMSIEPKPGD